MNPLEEDMEIQIDGCGVVAIGSVGKRVGVRAGKTDAWGDVVGVVKVESTPDAMVRADTGVN